MQISVYPSVLFVLSIVLFDLSLFDLRLLIILWYLLAFVNTIRSTIYYLKPWIKWKTKMKISHGQHSSQINSDNWRNRDNIHNCNTYKWLCSVKVKCILNGIRSNFFYIFILNKESLNIPTRTINRNRKLYNSSRYNEKMKNEMHI